MMRILVHVEGQTEENFVNTVLAPHLHRYGYTDVSARLLGNARQRHRRGGIRPWDSVRRSILRHLRDDPAALATTMVDYYELPRTWPGREQAGRHATLRARAAAVEQAILADVSKEIDRPSRFLPYVVMHEFEGLLFSAPDRFAHSIGKPGLAPAFQTIRGEFETPENINDSPDTAPSKRILDLYRGYRKPLMGSIAMRQIGLDTVRGACPLFDRWVEALERQARA